MRELSIPSLCGALLFAATSGCAATGDESTEERPDEAQQDVCRTAWKMSRTRTTPTSLRGASRTNRSTAAAR